MKKLLISIFILLASASVSAAPNANCMDATNWDPITNPRGEVFGNCTALNGGGESETRENQLYMGFSWSLGENISKVPDLVLGARSAKVKSSNDVNGVDLTLRISLQNEISFDSARLSYIAGSRDVHGNLGLGYSNKHTSLLATAAVQAAHFRAGTDYVFKNLGFEPYVEVNTLKRLEKISKSSPCAGGGSPKTIDFNNPIGLFGSEAGFYTTDPNFAVGSQACFTPATLDN